MATAVLKAKLTLNDSLFHAGIKRATASAVNFGKTAAKIGFAAIGAGIAAAGAAMIAGSKSVINLGDDLLRMSRITGISVSGLYVLREAFEQAGTSADAIGPAIAKMDKALLGAAKGNKTLAKGFEELGLNVKELFRMKPEDRFRVVGKAIGSLPDIARQAKAMELFGKAGLNMLPVFEELKDFDATSLQKMAQLMEKNATKFDAANDALRRMRVQFQMVFAGAAIKLAPLLINIGKALENVDFIAIGTQLLTVTEIWAKTALDGALDFGAALAAGVIYASRAMDTFGSKWRGAQAATENWILDTGKSLNEKFSEPPPMVARMEGESEKDFKRRKLQSNLDWGLKYGANFSRPYGTAKADDYKGVYTQGIKDIFTEIRASIGKAAPSGWRDAIKALFKQPEEVKAWNPPAKGKWDGWGGTGLTSLKGSSIIGGGGMSGGGKFLQNTTLQGASLLNKNAATAGEIRPKSAGMIWASQKRKQEAKEQAAAKNGIDKTNDILGEIKMFMQQGLE